MKAAVLYKAGEIPRYEDFPDPIPKEDEQVVIVKAASIKNLDKMRVKGTHYDSYQNFPVVVGVDGVGVLADARSAGPSAATPRDTHPEHRDGGGGIGDLADSDAA